jgi:hypothetical protein
MGRGGCDVRITCTTEDAEVLVRGCRAKVSDMRAGRIRGTAIVDMAHGEVRLKAVELGRRSMYSGSVLFDLAITFLVVRSFKDKPKGSNSIEHQLSMVKRQTERRF